MNKYFCEYCKKDISMKKNLIMRKLKNTRLILKVVAYNQCQQNYQIFHRQNIKVNIIYQSIPMLDLEQD